MKEGKSFMNYFKKLHKNQVVIVLSMILLMSSTLLSAPMTAEASAKVNQQYKPSYGVHYKNLNYSIGSKTEKVNVMEMDVADAFTEVQLGKPDPLDNLTTVLNRAKSYNKKGNQIVGAINANFYHGSERRPVHLISEENRLVYAGYINEDNKNTYVNEPIAFGIDAEGKGLIDHYNLGLTYTHDGKTRKISHTNRKRATNNTILYTSDFYKNNTDTNEWGTEVVLKGPKNPELTLGQTIEMEVDAIRPEGNKTPIKISDDYFVLSGHGNASNRLKQMKVGDIVKINVGMDEKWQGSEFMLAGGPLLVKDGKVDISMNSGSWNANAIRARTAVGIDKSREKVFFVTVDEKQANGKTGMNMKQLAQLMIDMGADTALNLDGGGSTTMVVLPRGGGNLKLANRPTDGVQRSVSGILMAADTEPERIFSDVSYRNSHVDGVHWLNDKGITGFPDGTYGVYDQLSRQQAAVMFTNVLGLEKTDPSVTAELFTDIEVDKTYADYIGAVAQAKIYTGRDGQFLPYKDMTRQQMATTIVNAFGLEETDAKVDINLDNVSDDHKKNVQILADNGITNALDDFRAYETITRGQFATFLYKASQIQ